MGHMFLLPSLAVFFLNHQNIIKPENWFINLEIHVSLVCSMFGAIFKGMPD